MPLTESQTRYVNSLPQLNTLYDKWLYAIKHLGELDERPAELKEAIFNRLFELAEIAKYTPQERMDYEESLKNFRDWYSVITTAEKKGKAEGLAEGMQKGKAEGLAEGLAEGMQKGKAEGLAEGDRKRQISTARSLKAMGVLSVTQISEATGLTEDEIEAL